MGPENWVPLTAIGSSRRGEMGERTTLSLDALTPVADGVYFSRAPVVRADGETVAFLTRAAEQSPRRRARLCAHPTPQAGQHDMLIVAFRDSLLLPHEHHHKPETFLLLEGSCDFLMFDSGDAVSERLPMAPYGNAAGAPFFQRTPAGVVHALWVTSPLVVFWESTPGPFSADASRQPPWAPREADAAAVAAYQQGIAC